MEKEHDIRWQQRYANYHRIINSLNQELSQKEIGNFSELERSGLSQWFELSYELMWKLLKDYLEYEEVELGLLSPKNILKTSAEVGLLEKMQVDGEVLVKIHQARNELTHIYDDEKALAILKVIQDGYLVEMLKLDAYFGKLMTDE